MSVAIGLDAREGLRGDATGRFEDVAVVGRDGGQPLARVPGMTTRISGFALREGALHLAQLAVDGTIGVRDPLAKQGAPLRLSRVRASVADLTWPATTPGRLDLQTSIPGGGVSRSRGRSSRRPFRASSACDSSIWIWRRGRSFFPYPPGLRASRRPTFA